jgi:hypothetical protein
LHEVFEELDAERGLFAEFYMDCADGRFWLGLACARQGSVFAEHLFSWARGEVHFGSLRGALVVGIVAPEFIEADVAFFVGEFVALWSKGD